MGYWSADFSSSFSTAFLVDGWSIEEDGETDAIRAWSSGNHARLLVPSPDIRDGNDRISLEVSVSPFVAGGVDFQDIWVYAQGLFCGFERLTEPGVVRGLVPHQAITGSTLAIEFVLPLAAAPAAVHVGVDERRLGVKLDRLDVTWA